MTLQQRKQMKRLLLAASLVCFYGCATHKPLTSMPKDEKEYSQSKEALVKGYSDIQMYEKNWRGFNPNFPLVSNVESHLGEPVKTKRDWWYLTSIIATGIAINAHPIFWGVMIAVRPDTPKKNYYKKGNHCIKAHVDKTFLSGYKPYVFSWEWSEDKRACEARQDE